MMIPFRLGAFLAGIVALAAHGPLAQAQISTPEKPVSFETTAPQAMLYDFSTRTILFERNADQPIQPAALVKIMTAAMVFREIREGRLKPDQDMTASTDAWRRGGAVTGGPNMLITPNKVVKVRELLTGLLVGSANDAAITLAENISGSEARFVEAMNAYARELGLSGLRFRNATGFTAPEQSATLRDLVRLSAHILETYPESYALFGQRDMPYGRSRQTSRNPLIALDIGADGLMAGSTAEGRHHLIGSAVQEGRRLIVAVAGLETTSERVLESRKLMEWGFRRFEIRPLFPGGTVVGEAAVFGGASRYVPLKVAEDLTLPVLRGTSRDAASLRVVYRGPLRPPLALDQPVARLDITVEGRVIRSVPLVAAEAVAEGSVPARARDALIELSRQGFLRSFRWMIEKAGFGSRGGEKPASTG